LKNIKKYDKNHMGGVNDMLPFEAIAISIEKYGVFFNIEKFQTSVLVRFESITNDSILKVSNFQAIGKKHKILVGSKYKILIDSIDDVKGKINAKLVV